MSKKDRVPTGLIVAMRLQTDKTLQEIAAELDISKSAVHYRLSEAGVDTGRRLKPIGCKMCIIEPYAHGLCRNCYVRARRRLRQVNQIKDRIHYEED